MKIKKRIKEKFMKNVFLLFIAVFLLIGCPQPAENGNDSSRTGTFEKDSLLIEIWDSSTPSKFLGYDTMLGLDRWVPIILTSKGYCVRLSSYNVNNINYGIRADRAQNIDYDDEQWIEIINRDGWGSAIFFLTESIPAANDTPYYVYFDNIFNNIIYNPHDGGTYYTWDHNKISQEITILANQKFYDNMGTIRSWNDNYEYFGEQGFYKPSTNFIGEKLQLYPLKKIGSYADLGLPDPAAVKRPLIYKVR